MFEAALLQRAQEILTKAREGSVRIATAESCTGGLIAALFTEIAGSSDVFERGFVTYSDQAKSDLLGVPADMISRHGAVSPQVAVAMAKGALAHSPAQIAVAVTGIAGPGGGTAQKPVGLVYIAIARLDRDTQVHEMRFAEKERSGIRFATVAAALNFLDDLL